MFAVELWSYNIIYELIIYEVREYRHNRDKKWQANKNVQISNMFTSGNPTRSIAICASRKITRYQQPGPGNNSTRC